MERCYVPVFLNNSTNIWDEERGYEYRSNDTMVEMGVTVLHDLVVEDRKNRDV